ncbi:branched-chain amino acid aminotransferase [Nisaea sp.]|uniref:branched-chain amino acid aminotransferase n=1 Tax=Nisaea sp. TaxID=2024842 RepID=UPI003B51D6B1
MKSLTYLDGEWHEGNPAVLGPATLATWLGAVIFDGARAFEGVAPDLDLHCQRACASAEKMGMKSPISAAEIEKLAIEGIRKFPSDVALYIKPVMWAEDGWIYPNPETTRFMLHIFEAPLPEPKGFSAHVSSHRRPAPDQAPTDAKAACLYPNAGRALREANQAGFDNAVMLDPIGNVAEFATANIFMARDGVVTTPAPNGTFLNGITRQRVIRLLRAEGVTVEEKTVTPEDLRTADEIWSTGNHAKVMPVTRFEDREMQPGPMATKARELYWAYAKTGASF